MTDFTNLDALITRNIGEILAAKKHAVEKTDVTLWKETGTMFVAAAERDRDWLGAAHDKDVSLTRSDWHASDAKPDEMDFWLEVDERTAPNSDGEESWTASFTGSGPEGASLALWVQQDILNPGPWKKLVKTEPKLVDELVAAGFQFDDDERRLCIPIAIDRELLAAAFEEGAFETALAPVAAAVRVAIAASEPLERLRQAALSRV